MELGAHIPLPKMRFFTGLHQPSDVKHFDAAFVSVNRLVNRKSEFEAGDWIMDSGAFSHMLRDGDHIPVDSYADQIRRWKSNGNLLAAVTQDYMCERVILERTGLTVRDHQRLTVERYDALLRAETGVYIMPVLQGYEPEEYLDHISLYGDRLGLGMWVGVGSVCKRNGDPGAIESVLSAIHHQRPDLRLHGFGIKGTALSSGLVQELLFSADSMAWSYSARKKGRNGNDWREAKKWAASIPISGRSYQIPLFIPGA